MDDFRFPSLLLRRDCEDRAMPNSPVIESFSRDGDNVVCEVPISFTQAALGAEIEVPSLEGPQVLHIPLLGVFNQILKYQMPPYDVSYTAIFLEAGMLGLLAGLCEETARLVGYWVLKGRAKTFGSALALGAGIGNLAAAHSGGKK